MRSIVERIGRAWYADSVANDAAPAPSPLATAEPWDLVAEGYVAENLISFEAFAREALRLVPATGDVLDVAAGPGSLALQAARTARQVHAIDFAPAMLAQLHARAAQAGIGNVITRVADGQALPFPDESFEQDVMDFCRHLARQNGEQMGAAKIAIEMVRDLGLAQARNVERMANASLILNPDYGRIREEYIEALLDKSKRT